jgi:hypothetical protein
MSLPVKDGGGNNVTLVSTLIGGEHAVHHVMLGSNDGGTTMQVLKTLADGTVVISGAVTVTGVATELTLQSAATFLTSIDASLADITRAEDAIHASGSRGVVALSVRRDTPTPTATDGDYTAFISGPNGGLWVETIGGATSALQTTGNASLDSLDGGLSDLNAKVPAAAALADNTANPTLSAIASYTMVFDGSTWDRWDRSVTMTGVGLPSDAAATTDTESTGLVGLTKRLLQRITTLFTLLPASLGSKASAASFPVVIASDQGSVAVANAGTFAVQIDGAGLTALQLLDNLVLAEDAAHVSGDAGIQSLAVRNDSDTSLAGTTGDYTPLQVDANGYLKVNIKAGAGSGGTASTDDAAFTAGSGSGTPIMGFVTSDPVDSGDVGVIGMLANRQVKVTLFDSAGSEVSVGSSPTSTGPSTTDNLLVMLLRIVKLLESNAIVDQQQRQRISVDSFVATVPTVSTVTGVTTCSTVTTVNTVAAQTTLAGMDREMHINAAKQTYSDSIRSRLTFA